MGHILRFFTKGNPMTFRSICALCLITFASALPAAEKTPEKTDDVTVFYALGSMVAESLRNFEPSEKELESILSGIRDTLFGDPKVDPMEYQDLSRPGTPK